MTDLPANLAALTDAEILDLANASDERTNKALVAYLIARRYGRIGERTGERRMIVRTEDEIRRDIDTLRNEVNRLLSGPQEADFDSRLYALWSRWLRLTDEVTIKPERRVEN